MGHRLTRIVTRTGDDGSTGLGDGSRTRKDTPRVQALGDVDELNAALGLALTETLPPPVHTDVLRIQHHLFEVGAELCIPGRNSLTRDHVEFLDERLAHHNATLPPLAEFVLPGGCRAGALLHMARTIARRAERSAVALPATAHTLQYLNRLSDLLFVLARVVNRNQGSAEALWQSNPR